MPHKSTLFAAFILTLVPALPGSGRAAESGPSTYIEAAMESSVLRRRIEYSVVIPKGHDARDEPLPLLLFMHGGGGSRTYARAGQRVLDPKWETGEVPFLVLVTPSAAPAYLDYKDGGPQWETFLTGEFLDYIRKTYNASGDPKQTLLAGVSMGGLSSLRFAFRHPEKFGAVAASEPAIVPGLAWTDFDHRYRIFYSGPGFDRAFGNPVDEAFWIHNNPASIAVNNARRIRESGLEIYFEAGDLDELGLHVGAQFLH